MQLRENWAAAVFDMHIQEAIGSADPAAGIVWAFQFSARGDAKLLAPEHVASAVADERGWTWIHLKLGDARCRSWVAQFAPCSEWAREILLGTDEHLSLEIVGSEFAGILPDWHLEFGHESEDIARLRFAVTDRCLITMRRAPLRSIEATRKAVETAGRFPNPISLLDAVMDNFAATASKHVLELRDELERVEDRVLSEGIGGERQRLGRIRLQVVRLHRQLSQLRTLLHRFEPRLPKNQSPLASMIGNLAQKFDEIDNDAGSVNERARLLQDEVAAKLNELTSRRLFALSVLTAALLPPTLVTGFFGMNTRDLPLEATTSGSLWALLIAAGAGAATFWALQRLKVF
jgi:zinc transporter